SATPIAGRFPAVGARSSWTVVRLMAGRNTFVPDVVCRIAVAASAADFKVLHRLRQIRAGNVKSKSGARIICLLVLILLSKFVSAGAAMDHELRTQGTRLPVRNAMVAHDLSAAAIALEANRLQTESAARSRDFGAANAGDGVAETARLRVAVRAGGGPRGNPLWAIPLASLTATRERPLLVPSRRPPAPPVSVAAPAAPPPVQRTPAPPERFRLSLIGVATAASEGVAVFRDEASKDVVRLRTGESHSGWALRSVDGREVTVEKDAERIRLALPATADQDGGVREIGSPARSRNAGAPPPSPPPAGDRAPVAITVMAAADGSASPALPPFITQAPPAVPLSSHAVPPSDGSAAPARPPLITRAPPS